MTKMVMSSLSTRKLLKVTTHWVDKDGNRLVQDVTGEEFDKQKTSQ